MLPSKENSIDQAATAGLARVHAALDASSESLVRLRMIGSGPSECCVLLDKAARLLEQICLSGLPQKTEQVARTIELLHGIEGRLRRLELLNDSAAALCRGWLASSPQPLDDYTPAGVWEFVRERGELRIRA
jgi:hypothetical protein